METNLKAKITVYSDLESGEKLRNYLYEKEYNILYSSQKELSKREKDVLRLIIDGKKNFEIGKKLKISENTVKAHTEKIYEKLGVKDRVQAAVKAVRENLI